MPFKKKTWLPTHTLKSLAKTFRKRNRKLTFQSNFDRVIYRYKQYADTALLTYPAVTNNNLGQALYAWQFALDMLPQYATFSALYDEYRIDKIEFTLRPRAEVTQVAGNSQGTVAQQYLTAVIIAIDHDDATLPASYNALREYGNAKEIQFTTGRKHVHIINPAVAMNVYNGITNGHSERFSPWIDMANTNVPHYGIKLAMLQATSNNSLTLDITVRYLLSFRQVR